MLEDLVTVTRRKRAFGREDNSRSRQRKQFLWTRKLPSAFGGWHHLPNARICVRKLPSGLHRPFLKRLFSVRKLGEKGSIRSLWSDVGSVGRTSYHQSFIHRVAAFLFLLFLQFFFSSFFFVFFFVLWAKRKSRGVRCSRCFLLDVLRFIR